MKNTKTQDMHTPNTSGGKAPRFLHVNSFGLCIYSAMHALGVQGWNSILPVRLTAVAIASDTWLFVATNYVNWIVWLWCVWSVVYWRIVLKSLFYCIGC